ncbi:hypothetical protein UA44_21540 [Klebsiella aerogenes]|nr:hypothetical protein UA44_21540 [Klebsiella aerogenes]
MISSRTGFVIRENRPRNGINTRKRRSGFTIGNGERSEIKIREDEYFRFLLCDLALFSLLFICSFCFMRIDFYDDMALF